MWKFIQRKTAAWFLMLASEYIKGAMVYQIAKHQRAQCDIVGNTYFKATVSPITTSANAAFTTEGVSKFKVPNSSSSPHNPHADAFGSPSRRGRASKLG